jgi:hypothetical protein
MPCRPVRFEMLEPTFWSYHIKACCICFVVCTNMDLCSQTPSLAQTARRTQPYVVRCFPLAREKVPGRKHSSKLLSSRGHKWKEGVHSSLNPLLYCTASFLIQTRALVESKGDCLHRVHLILPCTFASFRWASSARKCLTAPGVCSIISIAHLQIIYIGGFLGACSWPPASGKGAVPMCGCRCHARLLFSPGVVPMCGCRCQAAGSARIENLKLTSSRAQCLGKHKPAQ